MSTPVATTCPKCQQRDTVVEITRVYRHTRVKGFRTDPEMMPRVYWGDSETYEDDDWSPEYACQHCGYESSDAWEFLGTRGVVTPGSGLDDPAVLP